MSLCTLYAFLAHDVLGNVLAALIAAGTGYTAKKIRTGIHKRNSETHNTGQ
ncbi:hypothetical protein [Streptomyces sp. NPDC051109]|uniref:hypothetical protein n=1 Tax=Streptomyces sp. NPDC051109 TaxID=3365642 RepID=UPI003787F362